jgi:FKBP-type peptidyl-prolyl cis-trans isomerase SlyD
MKVSENTAVSIDYTLKNNQGSVIDSSEGKQPLTYIHGTGRIISGLEEALDGKEEGEEFSVTLEPEKAYGTHDDSLILSVSRERFENPQDIREGMQVQAQLQDGTVGVLTVKGVSDDQVTLDANHPLAGETLHFDVQVTGVREATQEELDSGQVR